MFRPGYLYREMYDVLFIQHNGGSSINLLKVSPRKLNVFLVIYMVMSKNQWKGSIKSWKPINDVSALSSGNM